MTRRKVDLNKKRSKAVEAALAEADGEKLEITEIEFDLDGQTFSSVDKISHMVGMHIGRLGNEDYSNAAQLESIVYALSHLIRKEDRKRFSAYLEDSEMTSAEMTSLLGIIIEEISSAGNSPSSASSGKGTTKSSIQAKED